MEKKEEKFVLKTNGKYVQVKRKGPCFQLQAADSQHNDTYVEIKKRGGSNNNNQIAFRFLKNQKPYSLTVKEEKLLLNEEDKNNNGSSDYVWFEKYNLSGNEEYGLKTVAEPRMYVVTTSKSVFSLSTNAQHLISITDEKAFESR